MTCHRGRCSPNRPRPITLRELDHGLDMKHSLSTRPLAPILTAAMVGDASGIVPGDDATHGLPSRWIHGLMTHGVAAGGVAAAKHGSAEPRRQYSEA